MILCPPDEGRYMPDEGGYTGTILDKACDSYNSPIKCFRHHITPSAARLAQAFYKGSYMNHHALSTTYLYYLINV